MSETVDGDGGMGAVQGGEAAYFVSPVARVVRSVIWGEPVYFTVTSRKDMIQRHHLRGEFYEAEELEIIRRWCPPGSVFCDIGANIGNHAVFALKFLRVRKVIVFEPNPVAIDVLLSNLSLNGCLDRCDISHLGKGLSDQPTSGYSIVVPRRNLAGGTMVEGGGDLELIQGDEALSATPVTFVKIDVEGMEMRVLGGLSATIARDRPVIFIEVDDANAAAFRQWVDANAYAIRERFRRYEVNENYLLVPQEKSAGSD